jgi:hypothetical protein
MNFVELQNNPQNIDMIRDTIIKFTAEGKKLGKDLKKYDAYIQMNSMLDNYAILVNCLEEMVAPNTGFGELHWKEINENIAPANANIVYENGVENIKIKNL